MRTIYIDSNYKCHIANDSTMTAVETDFFDGKCNTFVEGYCYDNRNGYVQIYPWEPYNELDAAQREYENQLLAERTAELAERTAELAELDALVLELQYNTLTEGL